MTHKVMYFGKMHLLNITIKCLAVNTTFVMQNKQLENKQKDTEKHRVMAFLSKSQFGNKPYQVSSEIKAIVLNGSYFQGSILNTAPYVV